MFTTPNRKRVYPSLYVYQAIGRRAPRWTPEKIDECIANHIATIADRDLHKSFEMKIAGIPLVGFSFTNRPNPGITVCVSDAYRPTN